MNGDRIGQKAISFLVFLSILVQVHSASYLTENLRSWYRGDSTTFDVVRGEYRSPKYSSYDVYHKPGFIRTGFWVYTEGAFIVSDLQGFLDEDFTVEFWFKRNNLERTGATTRGGTLFEMWNELFILNDGTLELLHIAQGKRSSTKITDLDWHHVALSFKSGMCSVYLDGELIITGNYDSSQFAIKDRYKVGPYGLFFGEFDEVGTYSPAASAEQIKAIFESGQLGKQVGEFRLEAINLAESNLEVGRTNHLTFKVENHGTLTIENAKLLIPVPPSLKVHGAFIDFAVLPFAVENDVLSISLPPFPDSSTNFVKVAMEPMVSGDFASHITITEQPGELNKINNVVDLVFRSGGQWTAAPHGILGWFPDSTLENTKYVSLPMQPIDSRSLTNVDGKIGKAGYFNGLDAFVGYGYRGLAEKTVFSVEGWVQRSSPALTTKRTASELGLGLHQGGVIVGADLASWFFGMSHGGKLVLGLGDGPKVQSDKAISDTNWHHVAVVRNQNKFTFYLDGEIAGGAEAVLPVIVGRDYYLVGAYVSRGPNGGEIMQSWWGNLDEITIYDQVITASDVRNIYQADSGKRYQDVAVKILQQPSAPFEQTDRVFEFELSSVGKQIPWNTLTSVELGDASHLRNLQVTWGTIERVGNTLQWNVPKWNSEGPSPRVSLTLFSPDHSGGDILLSAMPDGGDLQPANNALRVQADALSVECIEPNTSMVAWYPFDSDLSDVITKVSGHSSGHQLLDAKSGKGLVLPYSPPATGAFFPYPSTVTNQFTWSVWFHPAGDIYKSCVLLQAEGVSVHLNTDSSLTLFSGDKSANIGSIVRSNNWNLLSLTFKEDLLTLHLNGEARTNLNVTGSFPINQSLILAGGPDNFRGTFDDLTIYNSALSAAELEKAYLSRPRSDCYFDLAIQAKVSADAIFFSQRLEAEFSISNSGLYSISNHVAILEIPPNLKFLQIRDMPAEMIKEESGFVQVTLPEIKVGESQKIIVDLLATGIGEACLGAEVVPAYDLLPQNNRVATPPVLIKPITLHASFPITIREGNICDLTFTLDQPVDRPLRVRIEYVDETAISGVDYISGPLEILMPAGQDSLVVPLQTVLREHWSGDRSFAVHLSFLDEVGPNIILEENATATIIDSSSAPRVFSSGLLFNEIPTVPNSNIFNIYLDGISTIPLGVELATAGNTAKSGTHFVGFTNTFVFSPGMTNISIPLETIPQPGETFNTHFTLLVGTPLSQSSQGFNAFILDSDLPSSSLSRFVWEGVPEMAQPNEIFPVTVYALDKLGNVITNFNEKGSVSGSPSGFPASPIVVFDINPGRAQFLNVSTNPVDVSGWKIHVYDSRIWPGARTFTFSTNVIIPVNGRFSLSTPASPIDRVPGVYPRFFLPLPRFSWNDPGWVWDTRYEPADPIAVTLTDGVGNLKDGFFAHPAHPSQVIIPARIPESFWSGAPVTHPYFKAHPLQNPISYQRFGAYNSRSSLDWHLWAYNSSATSPPPQVKIPMPDIVQNSIHVSGDDFFTNGVWHGQVQITGTLSPVRLRMASENPAAAYLEGVSNPIEVLTYADLSVAVSTDPSVFLVAATNVFYKVEVKNPTGLPATNVAVRFDLSRFQSPSTVRSLVVTNGIANFSQGGIDMVPINWQLGEVSPFTTNTMIVNLAPIQFPLARNGYTGFSARASLSSDSDLNLGNNFEYHYSYPGISWAPNNNNLLAYWRAEGDFSDEVGLHHGSASNVSFTAGSTGSAFSFLGQDAQIIIPPAPSFARSRHLTAEMFLKLPYANNSISTSLLEQKAAFGQTNLAWSLELTNSRPVLRFFKSSPDTALLKEQTIGDKLYRGETKSAYFDLRDNIWHHILVNIRFGTNGAIASMALDGYEIYGSSLSLDFSIDEINALLTSGLSIGKDFLGEMDNILFHSSPQGNQGTYLNSALQAGPHGRYQQMPDTDLDQLPDIYEIQLKTIVNRADSHLDSDGDGASNLQEFISGTIPFEPSDKPQMEVTVDQRGFLQIISHAGPRQTVQLQMKNSVSDEWKPISEWISPADRETPFIIPTGELPHSTFFRLVYKR